jgi:hypothetical protein
LKGGESQIPKESQTDKSQLAKGEAAERRLYYSAPNGILSLKQLE